MRGEQGTEGLLASGVSDQSNYRPCRELPVTFLIHTILLSFAQVRNDIEFCTVKKGRCGPICFSLC